MDLALVENRGKVQTAQCPILIIECLTDERTDLLTHRLSERGKEEHYKRVTKKKIKAKSFQVSCFQIAMNLRIQDKISRRKKSVQISKPFDFPPPSGNYIQACWEMWGKIKDLCFKIQAQPFFEGQMGKPERSDHIFNWIDIFIESIFFPLLSFSSLFLPPLSFSFIYRCVIASL